MVIVQLVAFVLSPVDSQFCEEARRLLVVLAQRGGNPNMATFTAQADSPGGSLLVLGTSDEAPISCLLARVLLAGQHDSLAVAGAASTLDFFYKTLSQSKLRQLADGVQSYVTGGGTSVPSLAASRALLLRLTANVPRPLRILCRIAVADSLQWRLAKGCPLLPLPRTLLHYLVNFDL